MPRILNTIPAASDNNRLAVTAVLSHPYNLSASRYSKSRYTVVICRIFTAVFRVCPYITPVSVVENTKKLILHFPSRHRNCGINGVGGETKRREDVQRKAVA